MTINLPDPDFELPENCSACFGVGYITPKEPCPQCKETGIEWVNTTFGERLLAFLRRNKATL